MTDTTTAAASAPADPMISKPIDLVLEGGGVKGIGLVGAILADLPFDDPGADAHLTAAQHYTLVVHTADVTRGKVVRLPWDYPEYGFDPGSRRIVDAVRASMAIPFFFEPVRFRAPAATVGG